MKTPPATPFSSAEAAPGSLSGLLLRGAALLLIAIVLMLCLSRIAQVSAQSAHLLVFLLIVAVCGALLVLTRGVGAVVGAGIGIVCGVATALVLTSQLGASPLNQVTFVLIAATIMGALGHLAGALAPESRAGDAPTMLFQSSEPARASPPADPQAWLQAIDGLVNDFAEWVEHLPGGATALPAQFDLFLRTALRERVGARGVRLMQVNATGDRLRACEGGGEAADAFAPQNAALRHVLETGEVFLGARPAAATPDDDANFADSAAFDGGSWSWLLPLTEAGRVCAVVAILRVEPRATQSLALASAVRNQLQLFWAHLCGLADLRAVRETDRATGVLNRAELLSQLDATAAEAARLGEPAMVLVVALEGLRRLDDSTRWTDRDRLIERVGRVLRERVRTDDLLGRFADERFVVVLRRLDGDLGRMIAEKLLERVRLEALDVAPPGSATSVGEEISNHLSLRVRGGLAGSGFGAAAGRDLLERAMGLVDYARTQRIAIALDTMHGLPPPLLRPRHEAPPPAEPLRAALSPPFPTDEALSLDPNEVTR